MVSKNKDPKKSPTFPFDKMPYQGKGEDGEPEEYEDLGRTSELDLGESPSRTHKRSLREERDAGQEP
jgi:hypothetical protein